MNYKKLLLLICITAFSYTQDAASFGVGRNANGFTMSGSYEFSKPLFVAVGGNLFDSTGSDAYDFAPGLFDDPELGKVSDALWIAGGYVLNMASAKLYLGGGLSFEQDYFKYRDPSEILGDAKGIYYVVDDNESNTIPSLYIGASFKIGKEDGIFNSMGVSYMTSSNDFNLTFGMNL
ncbi:MAG: hypothetical protein HN636_04175 [Cryomorphaceae bacterium]|mgnify:FL=1|jgi:hypothetical protein|nr:hypothetical protein [Candidatus Neomarinimicrobiota bacterium]MBT5772195.1 hypothetical protein [Flavobacteriaceae bacterium]MBT6689128.1 hypothetical protein [Flavobacteriaceae bacterium]MBT7433971.1 hypothetical protein [Candidatus Neomarinimicrobiota bacterium]MBT7683637.1 hypothetical protein [Cryomorphaceae bacterium]